MIKLLLLWTVVTVAFLAAAKLLPGMKIKSTGGAIGAAAIFGLLNTLVGWFIYLLLGFATLGIGFLLGGVTSFVVSVILLKVTDKLSDELHLETTGTAVAAAFVIGVVTAVGKLLIS